MIAILNGEEAPTLNLFRGGSTQLNGVLLSDGESGPTGQVAAKGTQLDVTGDTITFKVYDSPTRKNAALVALAATLHAAPTGGGFTITIVPADIVLTAGPYYGFIERDENTGTSVEFSRKYSVINIK
jgi:hypothetical protein